MKHVPPEGAWPDNRPERLVTEHYIAELVRVLRFGSDDWFRHPPRAARQVPRREIWQVRLYERLEGHVNGTRIATREFKTPAAAFKGAQAVLTNLEKKR